MVGFGSKTGAQTRCSVSGSLTVLACLQLPRHRATTVFADLVGCDPIYTGEGARDVVVAANGTGSDDHPMSGAIAGSPGRLTTAMIRPR